MKRILVATDLSARSDRALLRSVLLARETGAALTLAHVIDDDHPEYLREPQRLNALELLDRTAGTITAANGIAADFTVVNGTAFGAIIGAAEKAGADLIVIGPHRRQLLDSFIGTTAERIVWRSSVPVLMANAVPSGKYRRTLVAVDFDDATRVAIRDAVELDLIRRTEVIALHVFDPIALSLMRRSGDSAEGIDHYVREEKSHVAADMDLFLAETGLSSARRLLKLGQGSPSGVILESAREEAVDLIVLGTNQRKGFEHFLIGSVAQGVLVEADCGLLVAPVSANSRVDSHPRSDSLSGSRRNHRHPDLASPPAGHEP